MTHAGAEHGKGSGPVTAARASLSRRLGSAVVAAGLLLAPVPGGAGPAPPPPSRVPAVPEAAEWQRVRRALADLDEREKAVLADLYRLRRAAGEARDRLRDAQARRAAAQAEVDAARIDLERARAVMDGRRQEVARLLRQVQYLGPASYLGVLLGAESWSDFTRRLGVVSAGLRGVRRGLGRLREAEADLRRRHAALAARETRLAEAVRVEEAEVARLAAAQAEQEKVLAGLGAERARYLERLGELEQAWARFVRPYVERVGKGFRRLAATVREVPGAEVGLTAGGVRLRLPEAGLNELLAADPDLAGLRFTLSGGAARLEAPDLGLAFPGRFSVRDGTALVYEVESVEVAGAALDPGLVREAMGGADPAIDLAPVLGAWRLRSVRAVDGGLEFALGMDPGLLDPGPAGRGVETE